VQALGQTPHILSSGHQTPDFYQAMCAALHRDGQWSGEIWNRRENGEVYAELLNLSAVFDATGQVQNYVALFSDITPLKEHEKELERIAHYDVLTGLPNRVLLADRLHQAMIQSVRRRQQLAVIYLDLDDSQAAVPLLDRLLTAAGESVQLGDVALQISASLGVTFLPAGRSHGGRPVAAPGRPGHVLGQTRWQKSLSRFLTPKKTAAPEVISRAWSAFAMRWPLRSLCFITNPKSICATGS